MFDFIQATIGFNHFLVSLLLLLPIFISLLSKNIIFLKKILLYLLLFNFVSFYIVLFFTNEFNYKFHLPLHLCYITEAAILISLLLNTQKAYPWLILNSMLGGIVGLINSNLPLGTHFIEYLHFYISHFNLLLFTIIAFKSRIHISSLNLFRSISFNTFLLFQVVIFNYFFNTNYWFTIAKPRGINIAFLFPEWPYYLFMFIAFGLISYSITYILLLGNRVQR